MSVPKSSMFIDLKWYEIEEGSCEFHPYLTRRFLKYITQERVQECCRYLVERIEEIALQAYSIKQQDAIKFNEMIEAGTLRTSSILAKGAEYQFFWDYCAVQEVIKEILIEKIDDKIKNLDLQSIDMLKIFIYYVFLSIRNSFNITAGISGCEQILASFEPLLQSADKNPIAYLNGFCNLPLIKSLAFRCLKYFSEGKYDKIIEYRHQVPQPKENNQKISFNTLPTVSLLNLGWKKTTNTGEVFASCFDDVSETHLHQVEILVTEKIKTILNELESVVYSTSELEVHQSTVQIELNEGNEIATTRVLYQYGLDILYVCWTPQKLQNIQNKYIDLAVDNKIAKMSPEELIEMKILIYHIVIQFLKRRELKIALIHKKELQNHSEEMIAHFLSNHLLIKSLAIWMCESKKRKKMAPIILRS